MTPSAESGDAVLVLTVGTENRDDPENSLFQPLLKSIRSTRGCNRVVLLPSSETVDLANDFLEHPGVPAELQATVHPLPEGAEYDADEAYAHFDAVLGDLMPECTPEQLHVDFTRGTKAMSAAAVLASARRAIPNLRYVDGDRDRRGMVRPGTERVRRIPTATVDAHRRRDLALDLMRRGNFSAVRNLLADDEPPSRAIRGAAAFYAGWDRLAYGEAVDCRVPSTPPDRWEPVWPTEEMRFWVDELARDTDRQQHKAMAHRLRLLVVDLLANAERRVAEGQFEDAYVRFYRILELVGQARLFDHLRDSSKLDPEDEAVKLLQARIRKKKQRPLERRGAHVCVGRFNASRLLKKLDDPLAKHLLRYEKTPAETALDPRLRNDSLLIHGFAAKAPADRARLNTIRRELEDLARADAQNSKELIHSFENRLKIARSMPFQAS